MKKLNLLFLFLLIIGSFSCTTFVMRSPDTLMALPDQSLKYQVYPDVFNDFLWTEPLLYGQKLDFENGKARYTFQGETCEFTIEDLISLTLKRGDQSQTSLLTQSRGDRYYNPGILGTKQVPVSRYVSDTRWVPQQVPVQKSRQVSEYVPVQRSRQVYDPNTNSYRTEWYTDYEWRYRTEWYTDWETRQVMETYWEWRTFYQTVMDIPDYSVFYFEQEDGLILAVYKIEELSGPAYYLQNISYLGARALSKSDNWKLKDAKVVLIDANHNGFFHDKEDKVLVNTWNPYNQHSAYPENHIPVFGENKWISLKTLVDERLLSISVNTSRKTVSILNANNAYIGIEDRGKIKIENIPYNADLIINGKSYSVSESVFSSSIEYGIYKVIIRRRGYLDSSWILTIDEHSPSAELQYKQTSEAGTFSLENHNYRDWVLMVIKDDQTREYINTNEINLLPGEYTFLIQAGGYRFVKKVAIVEGSVTKYNFAEDVVTQEFL